MVKKLDIIRSIEQDGGKIGNKRWKTELHILENVKLNKVTFYNVNIVIPEGCQGSITCCKFLIK